jgi:hypothetical protein
MSRHACPFGQRFARLTLLGIALLALGADFATAQPTQSALPYSRGYLLTGNYVVGAVDLNEKTNPVSPAGFSTGTISIAGVPRDADIVAAYLYWETITLSSQLSQASGAAFRGTELLLNDLAAVKKSSQSLTGATAACWSSGSALTLTQFRADVLRLLPIRVDKDNQLTGKRIVNSTELTANGLAPHTVTLPARSGNQVPESAGASLVIVYHDPSEPLRKIVLYDGLHVQTSVSHPMTQTLQGFYRSAALKSAKLTHITASGQPNATERVFFDDSANTVIATNAFAGGNASQRGWASPTYDVSGLMTPGNKANGGFGETATTTVDHAKKSAYDCLTWGAILFSSAVADVEGDGIPDGIEDAAAGIKDPPSASFPNGRPLPNLNAMGASSAAKDLFVEFNAMRTLVDKVHGSSSAPYPGEPSASKLVPPHTHMPTPDVLKQLGDLYASHGITPHFDVGPWDAYKAAGVIEHIDWTDDYTSNIADPYLVPSYLARGGEVVDERACSPVVATCQFPAYPGTVSWKVGLQLYRDSPVGDAGEELLTDDELDAWKSGTRRRRFDAERTGLFHYVLNAHARGKPRSEFPCLVNGVPSPYDAQNGTSCVTPNPSFHTPSSASGVADLPGGNAMVTLGFWDEHVGRPFVRASTTFHELGHNLNLWHGGRPPVWGDKVLQKTTLIEPNCKPTYQSAMSYLFQVHGLFDNGGTRHLDFSGAQSANVVETLTPADAPLFPASNYRPAWYAPAGSALAAELGISPATRYCSGFQFDAANPPFPMARVTAKTAEAPIDWNGDGLVNVAVAGQDINFDKFLTAQNGFDDWANLRLDQLGSSRRAVKFQGGDFLDFGSGDFLDFGSGDFLDFGSGDFLDFGSGDFLDFGSGAIFDQDSGDFLDFGSGDFLDFGSGDFLDFGSGDFLDFGSGSERQELDFEFAKELGRGFPIALTACIVGRDPDCSVAAPFDPAYDKIEVGWQPPSFGKVWTYEVSRKRGPASSVEPYAPVATTPALRWTDGELPNGVQFTYRVRVEFDETPRVWGPYSDSITETAVNEAPVALADNYNTTTAGITISAAGGVLANDTDVDSAAASIRAVLVSGPTKGTLTLNADGSFSYTPFGGNPAGTIDSFSYKADNGVWSGDPSVPMSGDSNMVTVTITITNH